MNKLHNIVALSLIATVLTAPTWILAQGTPPPPSVSTNTPRLAANQLFTWSEEHVVARGKELILASPGMGTLEVLFKYTGGGDRLDIKGVEAFDEHGVSIVADVHDGWTGNAADQNTYILDLGDRTATKLVCTFAGFDGGAATGNSNGNIWVRDISNLAFDAPAGWSNVPTTAKEDVPTTSLTEYIAQSAFYQTIGGREVIAVHVTGGDIAGSIYGLHRAKTGYSTLNKDVYVKISGGTHGLVTAGQESNWRSGMKTNITGNQLTEITGGMVTHVIGAGDKAGKYDGEGEPTLTGNAAIVISGDAIVKGNIVGGWTSSHNDTGTVTGNTSVRITKRLDPATVASEELAAGWIIGGGARVANSYSSSLVTGNTSITIDLPAETTGSFARKIVGGAYANKGTHSVNGSSSVTITAPNSVTFNDEIYGGGYRQNGTLNNKGLATVFLTGGTYTSTITAGSWTNTPTDIGPATLSVTGGIFDGATLRPGIATGDKTLIFNGEPTFTGASNIQAGFTSAIVTEGATLTLGGTTQVNTLIDVAGGGTLTLGGATQVKAAINVAEGGTLKLGGTAQVNSPITGNVTITGDTAKTSNTEILENATVSFEPNAKLNISITEAQKLVLTTLGNTLSIKLFNVTTGDDAGTVGAYVQLKYAEEETLTGLAFAIVDGVLYVSNTATDVLLLPPFLTALTGNFDWTLTPWFDVNGLGVPVAAWDVAVPEANITVPINQAVTLSIDQSIIVDTLNLLSPAEATAASAFTLALKASTTGAMTASTIDASTTTQRITLDLPTGVAEVRSGANTILTQAGTGSLIIGAGKKATLRNTNRATVTNNGTLVYEGDQTDVIPKNTGNYIEIDTAMSFGAYSLDANHLKVKSQGNVTIAGQFTIPKDKNLTIDGGSLTASSMNVHNGESTSQMIVTNGGQLIVNRQCVVAWHNPVAPFKWEITGENSLLKVKEVYAGNLFGAGDDGIPQMYIKDGATLSIGSEGVDGRHDYHVAHFYYDGGILTAYADWTHHRLSTTYITKGSTMTIDPASHTITYNRPITDEAVGDVGGGTLVIGRAGTTGTVKLTVANTYTSGTTLNAGTLEVAHAQALGTGTFTVARGATLKLTSLNGSVEAPALTIDAVTGTTGVVNVIHPLTEAQLAGDPIKLITIPDGINTDVFAWTFVDGATTIDPSTYTLTFDETTRIVSVQAVSITITDGNVAPEVAIFVNTLANGATVSLTADQANLLYLFNVTSWPANLATVSFKITDCVVLTGATVSLTVTLEGVTAGDDLNGVVSLKRGASLVSLTALTQGVTSTREGNTFTLTTAITEGESFFKAVVTK